MLWIFKFKQRGGVILLNYWEVNEVENVFPRLQGYDVDSEGMNSQS